MYLQIMDTCCCHLDFSSCILKCGYIGSVCVFYHYVTVAMFLTGGIIRFTFESRHPMNGSDHLF